MDKVKSCGVLLLRSKPELSFLLMKHTDRYDLPKGHVDAGETEIQCAMREMQEETGVSPDDVQFDPDFRFVHNYTVQYKRTGGVKKEKSLIIFLGRLTADVEIQLTEHVGYQWFPWNPPHKIQEKTIDPLLAEVARHLAGKDEAAQQ